MRFTFEGTNYRMFFRREKPREWNAHVGHDVSLIVDGGKTLLFCVQCERTLCPSADMRRVQVTHCIIQRQASNHIPHQTTMELMWSLFCAGNGTPHPKTTHCAGDMFTREGGRRAALKNALDSDVIRRVFRCAEEDVHESIKNIVLTRSEARQLVGDVQRYKQFRTLAWDAYLWRCNSSAAQRAIKEQDQRLASSRVVGGAQCRAN